MRAIEVKDDCIVSLIGHNIAREIVLSVSRPILRAGTTQLCDVRFRKDALFTSFELEFSYSGAWEVTCSEEIYFQAEGAQRLMYSKLAHGDVLTVKYAKTDATLFALEFRIDFERYCGNFDRAIDLNEMNVVTIGGKENCNLELIGPYTTSDLIAIRRTDEGYILTESSSRYGVLLNGRRIEGSAKIEDRSFISLASFFFYLEGDILRCSKKADLRVHGLNCRDEDILEQVSSYPRFNRNTRIKTEVDKEPIPVLDPPKKPQKPKSNIIISLLPAIGMLLVTVFLRGTIMANMSNSGYIIISACSISVGILASTLSLVQERRTYKKDLAERQTTYRTYIQHKNEEIEGFRQEELETLQRIYPSNKEMIKRVRDFSPDLFDRRVGDLDFADVCVGEGPRKAAKTIDYKKRETFEADDLAILPEQVCEKHYFIDGAPLTVPLATSSAVGVVGADEETYAVFKNMVIDLCTRQFPADLKVFFIVEERHEPLVHELRYLPHLQSEDLYRRNLVCDEESRNVIFEYLYKELTDRREGARSTFPHLVIFVWDECGLKNHPLSKFIDEASEIGVTFVFFERRKCDLPLGCNYIVRAQGSGGVSIVNTENDREKSSASFEYVSERDLRDVSDILAPLYAEEVSLEGTLTKNITLFQMLGILSADDLDLCDRWTSSHVETSLAAPLGISKTGLVELDLHDKAHGPHGLVAGTTGSGKSEVLQTYILTMATLFHPYEVGFLIIDFKGGGMVNQFTNLPHLIGAITNIDGKEIDRSLRSIKAELRQRQRSFAEAEVNHISKYIQKYKRGQVKQALPHLVIIVDEFAELKAEHPDFMGELISAARIGRSLGVHLILATQKPAGQVNEQIWSNSRFKLCLKVASASDSNEVIKSPLAAEIKEPGRAYLQVGNNEIFELFQSAYSGAPEQMAEDSVKEFKLFQVENSGKRSLVFEQHRAKADDNAATQLEAIVSHVANHCRKNGIQQLPSICLPALENMIMCPDELRFKNGKLPLGIYDDPDSQYQGEAFFDIDNTNVFILGSAQMGKTNILQLLIRGISQSKSPEEGAIYVMDFGSMVLCNYRDLGHVGGVVVPGEDERVKNLFKLLIESLEDRKRKLMGVGVSSFAAYLEAGYSDLPHVYLFLDNFATYRELYAEKYDDVLQQICRDGIAYGISVVISSSSTNGFGYKYRSSFATYIALTCNDTLEYGQVFDRCRIEPGNFAGRALFSIDKEIYEFQSYLCFAGEREIDRVSAIKGFVHRQNALWGGRAARQIPCIPDRLTLDFISENYALRSHEMTFALDYATIEPIRINLSTQFSLSIIGKNQDTCVKVTRALLAEIEDKIFDREVKVFIVDGIMRELGFASELPFVTEYHSDPSEIDIVFESVLQEIDDRFENVRQNGIAAIENEPYLITIVNSPAAIEHLERSKDLVQLFIDASKQKANMRILFVFSGLEDATVSYSSGTVLKHLKDARCGFVLTPLAEHRFFDVPGGVARSMRGSLEEGQAFFINGQNVAKTRFVTEK